MDGDSWMNTYKDNPIAQKFRDMFGNVFIINEENNRLCYCDPDNPDIWFELPGSDEDTWELIEQSVYKKENLLIKN